MRYPKLVGWHRQWCLPSAAPPLVGCLTLFPLRRSLCSLYSRVIICKEIGRKPCSPRSTGTSKRPPPHTALCPMLKRPSDKAEASQPPTQRHATQSDPAAPVPQQRRGHPTAPLLSALCPCSQVHAMTWTDLLDGAVPS